ncbi:MAG: pyridoxal phosphate-dependent aminotransferase [Pseudoxanthomonas sp.]
MNAQPLPDPSVPLLPYSRRGQAIAPFHAMQVGARAAALERAGHDVIHMEVGEPDFSTAAPIVEAGRAALAAGRTGYTGARGLPQLREALSRFYRSRYRLDVDPERILITPGGSGALLLASALLVDPGQRWLMADPAYPCNRQFLRVLGGEAQLVPTGADSAYQLTPAHVARHWSADTVAALVASPANPTGTLLSRAELAALAAAVKARGGRLVVDEIYHGLTYGVDAASVLEVDPDAFVLNSFSKYFGMTGWRLGWLVAPADAVPALERLAQNLYIAPSTIAQHAALACFEPSTLAILEARRDEFRQRRDWLLPALRELGFGIPIEPQGAFYLYADIGRFGDDAQTFCAHLLESVHVACTPGIDFGEHLAQRHVRFSYTASLPRLQEAVARIARALGTPKNASP